jgi:hypothetical protein
MCGILAVLGVAEVSLAKRSRIIELSRRYSAAPHRPSCRPISICALCGLTRPRPRPAIGWVVGVLRPFEERAEEIWCRVGMVQHLWANGISLVYLTLCSPLVVSIYINI